ncbi:MAG: SGNH/GDSL hydrolase family protein [Spirochaetaceae bacterium]
MSIKLFTIGDSISQGFMSAAAANTGQCYSTIIAELLKIEDYTYNKYDPKYKLGLDLELILRTLEKKYGNDINGLEGLGVIKTIADIFDTSEDYYERGKGKIGNSLNEQSDFYHNIACEGMKITDAWKVTSSKCKTAIKDLPKKDNLMGVASGGFYRNAYRILNPNAKPEFEDFSGLDWLKYHSDKTGIENTVLWIGANNALGTILDLEILQTPGDLTVLNQTRSQREKYNLWHPNDFKKEYSELLDRTLEALKNNKHTDWHCIVGTIPLVTITPIIKGIGEERMVDGSRYYQYYTYQPITPETAIKTGKYLKFRDALFIDNSITEFNNIIKELVRKKNRELGREAFIIADISKCLTKMAWKRNSGSPTYKFPDELKWTYPQVDTKYYHVNRKGHIEKGGIFSLDGVHPSYTGQGIIAHEFLKTMKKAGIVHKEINIDWDKIRKADSLISKPIKLMPEIYEHEKLIELLLRVVNYLNK